MKPRRFSNLFRRPLPECLIPRRHPDGAAYAACLANPKDSPYMLGYRQGYLLDVACPFGPLTRNWALWQAGRLDRKVDEAWAARYGRQRPARPRYL